MRKKILLLVCLMLLTTFTALAQTKTVTNFDLEKYRDRRISAEKDLRENYAKLGFPSPEELQRQREKSRIETEELSAKLRAERIEREKIAAEAESRQAAARQNSYTRSYGNYNTGTRYYGGFYSYGPGSFYRPRSFRQRVFSGPAWRADASGVIYEPGSRPAAIWTPRIAIPTIRPRQR